MEPISSHIHPAPKYADPFDKIPQAPAPVSAATFLQHAQTLLMARGAEYDRSAGERSGPRIAAAFNAITGHNLTAAEVYLLLQVVKDVRQWTAEQFHRDSAEDSVSYSALKSEALAAGI